MRRSLPLLLSLLLAAGTAAAQSPSVFPGPGTLLRISEAAEVSRAPDEVSATLRFEAREAASAGAQAAVNRAMAAALELARGVPGVTATTGSYNTFRQEDPARWVASQTLSLRADNPMPGNPAALLELVGALQSRGLALAAIQHGLKRDTARTARQEAAALALDALRRRAEAVAGGIGMRVERIAEIDLNGTEGSPPRPMMAAMARGTPAPVAQVEEIVVGASAQAVVVLVPN